MRLNRALSAVVGAATALISALAMTTLAPAAQAQESDVTPYIIGGGTAGNAPWAARLFRNGQQNCSATIIAPTWILTAQHCVASSGTYTFRVGSLDQTTGGTLVTATRIIQHPSVDLALAQLDRSVSATYAPLGTTSAVQTGQTVQLYGWGATCTNQPEINCQSRYLKVANTRVTSVNGRDYRGGVAISVTRVDGIAAGGDSGGPMFATSPVDGKRYQVGVASTSDRSRTSNYTAVTRYRDWIRSYAGV
ncbi:secreted trypsin-like serine protease [Saccharothrix tamanrassetensis]|uniref:Secreted trypsin-like serine protease n=1 Tax=Saccharothrix tamanrassetensis TaxID=1051531 RepID=A0A841CD72_9PSEU|nr:trypsin-like serine protease [Saccharothrix tamanrassetensis]MBB5955201.1 secreted trypsin-like serine protease [Saccharothrix tamanrassetensis]